MTLALNIEIRTNGFIGPRGTRGIDFITIS